MNTDREEPPAIQAGHDHTEAFCLMQYQDEVSGDVEVLWNSRDGVTPFVITSQWGNAARHINWQSDRYAPNHVPDIGDRIFVDMTRERYEELQEEKVEKYWDHPDMDTPMSDRWDSKEEAVSTLVSCGFDPEDPGPTVVTVDEDVLRDLGLWEDYQEINDTISGLKEALAGDGGGDVDSDLKQAVRDMIYDAEWRDGFRHYAVHPDDMRELARLVDLDNYLDH